MNETIKFVKEKIRETERSIRTWKMMLKKYPNDRAMTKCLNIREKELQTLEQIKCELEAWEEDYQTLKKALEVEDANM